MLALVVSEDSNISHGIHFSALLRISAILPEICFATDIYRLQVFTLLVEPLIATTSKSLIKRTSRRRWNEIIFDDRARSLVKPAGNRFREVSMRRSLQFNSDRLQMRLQSWHVPRYDVRLVLKMAAIRGNQRPLSLTRIQWNRNGLNGHSYHGTSTVEAQNGMHDSICIPSVVYLNARTYVEKVEIFPKKLKT